MSTVEMAGTFRRAAKVIRDGGLAQSAYEDGTRHCTVGALMAAKGVPMFSAVTVQSEVRYLARLIGVANTWAPISGPGSDTVTCWNDAGGRTAEDVVTLLEQAAEKLEANR